MNNLITGLRTAVIFDDIDANELSMFIVDGDYKHLNTLYMYGEDHSKDIAQQLRFLYELSLSCTSLTALQISEFIASAALNYEYVPLIFVGRY